MIKVKNVDDYIATFPPDVQEILERVRATIRKAAPKAEETIKYAIPTYVLNRNLVHFAGYKNHIGFYPGSKAIEVFADELTDYKLSKGTIQFPIDKKMPMGLITRIVKYRVAVETKG